MAKADFEYAIKELPLAAAESLAVIIRPGFYVHKVKSDFKLLL